MSCKKPDPNEGLLPPKRRKHKHQALVKEILALEPGDFLEIPIPRDRPVQAERRVVERVLDRYCRHAAPEYMFQLRLTQDRRVRITCRIRNSRGTL